MKIYDKEGNLLGSSGLLRPGEYLKSIELSKTITSDTPITVKVFSYEPDTYFSHGSASANLVIKAGS